MALLPTLAAGWLYVQAQAQAGVQSNLSTMSVGEVLLWYGLTPVTAAFLEETIWRLFPDLDKRRLTRATQRSSVIENIFIKASSVSFYFA